jgi:polyisoprenoid-binding protein YceI
MKQVSLLLVLLTVTLTSFGQKVFNVDKSHARLGFTVTHATLSEVDGNFKSFDATLKATKDDLSDATFELTGDVNSLNTDSDARDGDLKKEDFFNAAGFPKFTFKSTSITKVIGNQYKLAGQLTMKGVTLPVTLDLWMNGPVKNEMFKKNIVGIKALGKLNRVDFKIGAKMPGFIVGEEVALRFVGEFNMPL